MVDYSKAKEIAQKQDAGVNSCLEYKDAYMFYNSKARGDKLYDREVIVLKNSGKVVTMMQYIEMTDDNSKPKTVKF